MSEPVPPAESSVPDLDQLDSGWDEDDEPDDDDPPEPDLPDERHDPVAHAAATKARDERTYARRERKRAKSEAKAARRKARAGAARAGQKTKTKRSRPPAETATGEHEGASAVSARATPPAAPMAQSSRRLSTNVRMLAIALVVFATAAIFAAVVAR